MILTLINIIFTSLFVGGAIYFWNNSNRMKKGSFEAEEEDEATNSLISISVPKNNDRTPMAAEQLFAALHGIYRAGASKQPQISCEIVSKGKLITFYMYVPTDLRDFVLSQVYSQYPNVDVKELSPEEDYARVMDDRHIAATELSLKRPTTYPIKTFQNFEVDPLSAITGVLSSAGDNEEIWAQLIIQPIDDDWQDQGEAEIKNIKEPPKKPASIASIITKEASALGMEMLRTVATGGGAAEKKDDKKDDKKELPGTVQQAIKGIEEKITKLGFEATIRLVAAAPDQFAAQAKLEQLIGAFKQYNSINLNSFISKNIVTDKAAIELYHNRTIGHPEMIFNITELASIYHFPSETVSTPTIAWAGAKKGEPPGNLPILGTVPADELTVFAQSNFRNQIKKFGLKKVDRRLHTYIIGKTGTGKSTLMENMIFDDIREGRGVAVVDPHGELIEHILDLIPEERLDDVIYFNPSDYDYPVGFNVLESVDPDMKNIIASGVVGIFKKIFGESWGPRLEYILRNAILALLEYPNATLLGVMRILSDNSYRRQVISYVKDPVVRDFFMNEYEKYEPKFRQEAIAPIQNKVGQFTSSSTIRNIIGQPKSTMDIRKIMDEGKILLANLSTGRIGEDNSALLGAMLITKIQLAAMSRTNITEAERRDFYLYVDEFQNFATDSFATILSEARKYRLNLVMINQYINQMPETVANAVFGNVGTMIAFRVGAADAQSLIKEFEPIFDANDLVNQPNRHIYIKMAIDGVTVPAFSAGTLPPPAEKYNLHDQVVARSRAGYGSPRNDVEEYIADWSMPMNLSQAQESTGAALTAAEAVHGPKASTEKSEKVETPPPAVKDLAGESESPKVSGGVLPENKKIQMLNDRFNRKWYAVSGSGESREVPTQSREVSPNSEPTRPAQSGGERVENEDKSSFLPTEGSQSGGERVENDHLITWDKASELGLKLENPHKDPAPSSDDLLPIDEL